MPAANVYIQPLYFLPVRRTRKKISAFLLVSFLALTVSARTIVHVQNSAQKNIANATVFASALNGKVYARYDAQRQVYYFDALPAGYHTIEVYAKNYLPLGRELEDSSEIHLTLKRLFEQQLQGSLPDGSRYYYPVGYIEDTFYQPVEGVLFVSKAKGFSHEDVSFYQSLGLEVIPDFMKKGASDELFLRRKDGKPFERWHCPELYRIRTRDKDCFAGVPVYVSPSAKKMQGTRRFDAQNIKLLSNYFYSPAYESYYAVFRDHLPAIASPDSWRKVKEQYESDSVKLERWGIGRQLLPQGKYKGQEFDPRTTPICYFLAEDIGEGVLDHVFDKQYNRHMQARLILP